MEKEYTASGLSYVIVCPHPCSVCVCVRVCVCVSDEEQVPFQSQNAQPIRTCFARVSCKSFSPWTARLTMVHKENVL